MYPITGVTDPVYKRIIYPITGVTDPGYKRIMFRSGLPESIGALGCAGSKTRFSLPQALDERVPGLLDLFVQDKTVA
jgi:hypothetical protein